MECLHVSINNKVTLISDFVLDHGIDIFGLQKTWLTGTDRDNCTLADIKQSLPSYNVIHNPRTSWRGCGVGFIIKSGFACTVNSKASSFNSFEVLDVTISMKSLSIRMLNIYRPPASSKNRSSSGMFLDEFSTLLESTVPVPGNVVLFGDFNFHVNSPEDRDCKKLLHLTELAGFQQHITAATHRSGHTLNLKFSCTGSSVISDLNIRQGLPSDHYAFSCYLDIQRPAPLMSTLRYRKLRDIDLHCFKTDIKASVLLTQPAADLVRLSDQFENVLRELLDKHAPEVTKSIIPRPNCPWFSEELRVLKQLKRRAELQAFWPRSCSSDLC